MTESHMQLRDGDERDKEPMAVLLPPMSQAGHSGTSTPTRNETMSGIMYPGRNDVMLGRGGESNYHSGNLHFRQFADLYKDRYRRASKLEKAKIAMELVTAWRSLEPPGRFLARTDPNRSDSLWHDVGTALAAKRATKTLGERSHQERKAKRAKQNAVASDVSNKQAHVARMTSTGSGTDEVESYPFPTSINDNEMRGTKGSRQAINNSIEPLPLSYNEIGTDWDASLFNDKSSPANDDDEFLRSDCCSGNSSPLLDYFMSVRAVKLNDGMRHFIASSQDMHVSEEGEGARHDNKYCQRVGKRFPEESTRKNPQQIDSTLLLQESLPTAASLVKAVFQDDDEYDMIDRPYQPFFARHA